MTRKLYIVLKEPLFIDVPYSNYNKKRIEKLTLPCFLFDEYPEYVSSEEKIHKIFLLGSGEVTSSDLEKQPEFIKSHYEKGSSIEKTESRVNHFFTELLEYPLIGKKFLYKVIKNHRSYSTAKHISKNLKDEETGLIVVDDYIFPEEYIATLAPDIEINFVGSSKKL